MNLSRRTFLKTAGAGSILLLADRSACSTFRSKPYRQFILEWNHPPREFSQAPFWFWNDALSEGEIARQMQDFYDHGVYGFVIHPRAGLPRNTGWMSERMIRFMRFAIEEAARKDMWVVLYDEGMYPSGSASGLVVAENPAFRPKGLFAVDLDAVSPGETSNGFMIGKDGLPVLSENQHLIAIFRRASNNHRFAVLDRYIQQGYSVIRGLHFLENDPPRRSDYQEVAEDTPAAADILNPDAVACFIRLVYQRFHDEFGGHFGNTIRAIFTDEPSLLGRRSEPGAVPGNATILEHLNTNLGYDFTPHLLTLWFDDEPDAAPYREIYLRALQVRLEETYYRPISSWCQTHGIALTGHPAGPDDIGHLRHFQIPGQDIVWRYVEPGQPSALEGAQSTQAKCASSAMIHLGRRRNANEYCGAYGHHFTFREMRWLANWLLIRGCNLLYPHAFYYSVRGPRIDERPPDVGPNSTWWEDFRSFADATSRLCWLNTDNRHVCEIAILGLNDFLPWSSARVCFEHQFDFNYLEARHLWEDAQVNEDGISIANMLYKALVVEIDPPQQATPAINILDRAGRVVRFRHHGDAPGLLSSLSYLIDPDIIVSPKHTSLRIRHVMKNDIHCYLLFNEGETELEAQVQLRAPGTRYRMDVETGGITPIEAEASVYLNAHQMTVIAASAFDLLN